MVKLRPNVGDSYQSNLDFIEEYGLDKFAKAINGELACFRGDFRIHVSGDFYSPEYVYAWANIVLANPEIQFWTYTRSWLVGRDMLEALKILGSCVNMNLWASLDRDTGDSSLIVDWPRAYLSLEDSDVPTHAVEMVFRNNGSKKSKDHVRKLAGNQVCPLESGRKYPHVSCASCRLCVDKITETKAKVVALCSR
jgi:hypothetical protein